MQCQISPALAAEIRCPALLDPQFKRALADRIRYYNELGIYDFYRRETTTQTIPVPELQPEQREEMPPRAKAAAVESELFVVPKPEASVSDPVAALRIIREDLGDCTRCRLAQAGTQADRLRRRQSPGGSDVHRRSSRRRRRQQGRAFRGPGRTIAQQHDQGHGPAARRRLHRQHHQVPSAR